MRKIRTKWNPCLPGGGLAIEKWEMLIIIDDEPTISLSEAEAGALLNSLQGKIDIPLHKRKYIGMNIKEEKTK